MRRSNYTRAERDSMAITYLSGKSTYEVARDFNMRQSTVHRILAEDGIPLRSRSECQKIKAKRLKELDTASVQHEKPSAHAEQEIERLRKQTLRALEKHDAIMRNISDSLEQLHATCGNMRFLLMETPEEGAPVTGTVDAQEVSRLITYVQRHARFIQSTFLLPVQLL